MSAFESSSSSATRPSPLREFGRFQLRRLLGPDYPHLAAFLSYLEMCLAWVEANPEIESRCSRVLETFTGG